MTPLEALQNLTEYLTGARRDCFEELSVIENVLKEKETLDGVFKILKEVIEFKQMLPHIEPNKDNGFDIMSAVGINIQRDIENKEKLLLRQWVLETCFPKELKALEIINKKEINVALLKNPCVSLKEYNVIIKDQIGKPFRLTQEEYNLLKEVLL